MNYPAASCGVSKAMIRTIQILSPPNAFIGGSDPGSPGFPLKACGNDGLRTQQAAGNEPSAIQLRLILNTEPPADGLAEKNQDDEQTEDQHAECAELRERPVLP